MRADRDRKRERLRETVGGWRRERREHRVGRETENQRHRQTEEMMAWQQADYIPYIYLVQP